MLLFEDHFIIRLMVQKSYFANAVLGRCFPNFSVCWHSKKAKQISLHNGHMNLFMLIGGSITGDREKGDDLFFEITTFSGNIT